MKSEIPFSNPVENDFEVTRKIIERRSWINRCGNNPDIHDREIDPIR